MNETPLPDWVKHTLDQILTPQFYGKITLHVKDGEVVIVREERTHVADNHSYDHE